MLLDYEHIIKYMESSKYPEPISMKNRVEIIKEIASEKNIKLKDISKAVGFHKSYFSKWAAGNDIRGMHIDELVQICRILHVPLELLLFGKKYRDLVLIDKEELRRIASELNHLIE